MLHNIVAQTDTVLVAMLKETLTDVLTCNLDDCSDPVHFTGQYSIRVQDLNLHPHGDVIPLVTHGSLQVGQVCSYRSLACGGSCALNRLTPRKVHRFLE